MAGFDFDFRRRTPDGLLGRAVASAWYAHGTVPYRRERVAPTGSTVAVIVLGDPIIETAGGPRAVPVRAERGFLIGPHDRPVTNEPTGETFAVGIVTTPVGCRAALGVDPAAVAGRVEDLMEAWPTATDLRERLLATPDPEGMLDLVARCLADGLHADVPGLDRCERAVAMLQGDPVRPIADIAAALGVSHGHLDREFTRIVGLAPRRLARLLRVERLLEAIDLADPAAATETQLRNIEAATGMNVGAFAAVVAERGIDGHAQILAFLKAEYGLSHGNANAVALKVRELAGGGPASPDALLDAQYAGAKAALRPVYEQLASIALGLGPDVEIVVQKTGVAFRRRRQFAVVQAASAKRVQLGLNLGAAPDDPRVVATPGAMCAFRVDLPDAQSVDADVARWLREGYERAG